MWHTFEKSGGGFFPLHKLDNAQTRFFVIDSLGDCFNSLRGDKNLSVNNENLHATVRNKVVYLSLYI